MATPELETSRLILRPLQLSDADQVQPLFARWEIVKQLHARVPWPFPDDGVRTYYTTLALPAIERGEEWHWTIRRKEAPDRIIGAITLHLNSEVNRGFWITPEWQRRGLMTEAAAEVTRFWFEDLQQPILRVRKARENIASRAISVRQGMRCVAETEENYVSGRLPTEVWELTAEDWRNHQAT